MLAYVESLLTNFLSHFTYIALVLVLSLAGLGLPIPEDIPLAFSGYLCNKDHSPLVDTNNDGQPDPDHPEVPNVYVMIAAGMIGVLLGDSIVFTIGRRGIDSDNFVARHLRKVLHSKRREKVERHFARHGNLTVFAGRFMPGFRSIVFAFAGMSKMSYPRFLLIDGTAAVISVPIFIGLGYYFADRFEQVRHFIEKTKHIVGPAVVLAIIGAIAIYYVRRKRRLAAAPAPVSSEYSV